MSNPKTMEERARESVQFVLNRLFALPTKPAEMGRLADLPAPTTVRSRPPRDPAPAANGRGGEVLSGSTLSAVNVGVDAAPRQVLPREKPVPAPKPLTRWEKCAPALETPAAAPTGGCRLCLPRCSTLLGNLGGPDSWEDRIPP